MSICVPNYFCGLNARQLLIQALQNVFRYKKIYLVPEPVAALASYTMVNKIMRWMGIFWWLISEEGTTDFSFLTISRDTRENHHRITTADGTGCIFREQNWIKLS